MDQRKRGPVAKRRAKKTRARQQQYRRVCAAVDRRDGRVCRVCGRAMVDAEPLHHHHIQPRSLGGLHRTENLIVVDGVCHSSIHDKRVTVTGNADETLQITWRDA